MKWYKGGSAERAFYQFPVASFLGQWGHTKRDQISSLSTFLMSQPFLSVMSLGPNKLRKEVLNIPQYF